MKVNRLFTERFAARIPYRAERITEENIGRVQAVLESNTDYIRATQPHPVSREDCIADITALPPGKSMADKTHLLLSDETGDLAVIDFIEGYPDEKTGYLGLFILMNSRRGRGTGTSLFQMLEEAARQCGFSRIELGCYESNASGMRFWKSIGFVPARTTRYESDGVLYVIQSLEKQI